MWFVLAGLSVLAIIVVVGLRMASSPPPEDADVADPDGQTEAVDPGDHRPPPPGSHRSAHREDGSPVPGSEEHRNRHGRR